MINPVPVVRSALQHLSSIVWLLIDTVREMGDHMRRGRFPFRLAHFFEQTDRAGVGSGVLVTTQQSALALGVAALGTLFLSLIPGMGMQDALVITLLTQLGCIALTGLLSLRLPRTIG